MHAFSDAHPAKQPPGPMLARPPGADHGVVPEHRPHRPSRSPARAPSLPRRRFDRAGFVTDLSVSDLAAKDLRRADLISTFLPRVNLRSARLEKAKLS